jgi:fructoselysine 6-phosphate deglycase
VDPYEVLTPKRIDERVSAAVEVLRARPEITNVFLTACGGSFALMMPLQHILQSSTALEAHALNAREFTTRAPKTLGPKSLVILCSHSGDTPETVEAARFAREHGALTIALTHKLDSSLAQASEFVVGYQHGAAKRYAYTSAPLLYRIIHALVDRVEGSSTLTSATGAVEKLDGIVEGLLAGHHDRADAWAKAHARSGLIYTMGSGPNYGSAYSFAICLLQEMLWVHSQGINSAEYFHGPFEITDFDVPFIDLLGLGASRPIDERAHAFLVTKSDDVLTLDAADWDLDLVPEALRSSFAHLVFTPLLRLYAERLADHRGHPLTVRRYMWRMEY